MILDFNSFINEKFNDDDWYAIPLFETSEDHTWFAKSKNIAKTENYIDKLSEIYKESNNDIKEIDTDLKGEIESGNIFNKSNKDLIEYFLFHGVSPIKSPFISLISYAYNPKNKSKFNTIVEKNPETINKIASNIKNIDKNTLINILQEPIRQSRQFGQSFRNWTKNHFENNKDITIITQPDKLDEITEDGIYIYCATSDTALKTYASKFGYKDKKGLDFLCKMIKRGLEHIIIGEAKFLSTSGGSQDRQLDNAINISQIKNDKLTGIGIVDGYIYLSDSNKFNSIKKSNNIVSALLLDDYIKDFYKNL